MSSATKNWILLRSGSAYEFGKSDSKLDFRQDVIVPLGRVVRYGGHTTWAWTVAAHAACAAQLALDAGLGKRAAHLALHHDDGEALVGDIMSPLKRQLAEFERFEDAACVCIATNAGYELPKDEVELATVKALDLALLEAERRLIKAPLAPGLTWNIQYDKDLADRAEQLVYATILREENWQGSAEYYTRMYKELG